jgi:hypothetical protein
MKNLFMREMLRGATRAHPVARCRARVVVPPFRATLRADEARSPLVGPGTPLIRGPQRGVRM